MSDGERVKWEVPPNMGGVERLERCYGGFQVGDPGGMDTDRRFTGVELLESRIYRLEILRR